MAYRQFILWAHRGGQLGKHNRRVIPACVVSMIRRRFPEKDAGYVGYKEVEEAFNFN